MKLDSLGQGLVMLWATRIVFAIVLGFALWETVNPTSLWGFIGSFLFLLIWVVVCVYWMGILEALIEKEREQTSFYDLPTDSPTDDLDL